MNEPIKVALVAHNARFTHTNPAIRSMLVTANDRLAVEINEGRLVFVASEVTINDPLDARAARLDALKADIYLFSAYIWNVAEIREVAEILKKANPARLVGCGGPEVSYTPEEELCKTPWFDFILCGEGELQIVELGQALLAHNIWPALEHLPAITQTVRGMVCRTTNFSNDLGFLYGPQNGCVNLDAIPFLWDRSLGGEINQDKNLSNRMLYYESSRGCPFHCIYCLSSVETGLRLRDLSTVFSELKELVERDAMLVKFVDRSFNASPQRAKAIWAYLIESYKPGQRTRFHFEIEADLMDPESLALLSQAPPHLFQFEIGVQTTNPAVLRTIKRQQDNDHVAEVVNAIRTRCNIHLHLDLIAGLPGEDMDSLRRSFNDVYKLKPDVIQLGFLKILKGTPMETVARERGFAWRNSPPYEVIASDAMDYNDILSLKCIETVLDRFYNQPWLAEVLEPIVASYAEPFSFYEEMAQHAVLHNLLYRRVAAEEWYAELLRFGQKRAASGRCEIDSPRAWFLFFQTKYQAQQRRGRLSWDGFVTRYRIQEP
ncbi:MAG TPA: B12-binding domain-containing radical SAM protein [Clostridiaceae bacterium]|nr:B12-binding domain-containing radical SAM protein [Clostridiaceae bacterium]